MYKVGDTVFYPMHGAGKIKEIKDIEILDQKETYYIISMPGDVTIKVPTEKAEDLGLRNIIAEDEALNILDDFKDSSTDMNEKWSERYQENKEKLKTGDINEISNIYKSLSLRNRRKNLSTSEKKMLNNTRQVFFTELSASLDKPLDEVENEIDTLLDKTFDEYNKEQTKLEEEATYK